MGAYYCVNYSNNTHSLKASAPLFTFFYNGVLLVVIGQVIAIFPLLCLQIGHSACKVSLHQITNFCGELTIIITKYIYIVQNRVMQLMRWIDSHTANKNVHVQLVDSVKKQYDQKRLA